MDRKAAIESAILRLTPESFTADGKPSVGAINSYLWSNDFLLMTAKERDELWAEREAEAKNAGAPAVELEAAEPELVKPTPEGLANLYALGRALGLARPVATDDTEPAGMARITLTSASSDPVPLYVHGVGFWSIRIGETVELPVEALDALRNSDCTFTQE